MPLKKLIEVALPLEAINKESADADPVQRFVRLQIGIFQRFPTALKLLLPCLAVILFWLTVNRILVQMSIVPPPASRARIWKQAAVLGLGAVLIWKSLLVGLLALHILNSYVYLGNSPLRKFISALVANMTPRRSPLFRRRIRSEINNGIFL